MAEKLSTEIAINLAGNLIAKARQYGGSISEFAGRHQRSMRLIQATSAAAGRGLDMLGSRYTSMVAGFAGGAMLKNFTQLDRQLTRMGLAAGKTKEEMRALQNEMADVSIKFKIDDKEVLSAVSKIGTVTGDLGIGINSKDTIAASIAATGGEVRGEEMGLLISTLRNYGMQDNKEYLMAMDSLNNLGKEGAFELTNMARDGVQFFALANAAGAKGIQGVTSSGAVLQAAMGVTQNAAEASTMAERFISDVQNPKTMQTLLANKVQGLSKDGKITDPALLLKSIAEKSSKSGLLKQLANLDDAGFNGISLRLIKNVTDGQGAKDLERYMKVTADGTGIMKDAEYAAQDFTSSLTALQGTWNKFANNKLAGPVQELADALNKIEPDTAMRWLEVGKNIALVGAGLVALRKTYKAGKGLADILSIGKGSKGVPGGITDVFGSGVMPVYVVNMGAGGMGGGLPGSGGKPGSNIPGAGKASLGSLALGVASRGAGALGLAYAATEAYDYIEREHPEAIEFDKMLMEKMENFLSGQYLEPVKQLSTDITGVDLKANANPDFAVEEKSWDPYGTKNADAWRRQETMPTGEGTLWGAFTDYVNQFNDQWEPVSWGEYRAQEQGAAPEVMPELPELKGEIRVVVEGDARVKSASMNIPGIDLSASAGVAWWRQS